MDLQEAAARLGVHYQTAYKWIRDGSLAAVKRGHSYDVDPGELDRFIAARRAPAPPPKVLAVRDWPAQEERLHKALVEGDELAARAIVERLHDGGVEALVLMERLFAPVLARIGDDWASGRISIAEEHRASAVCERLLARLAIHPRGRPRGVAVVATPPGEEHSLPAAMATVALRGDRWQVHHLGTQVPDDDLVGLARSVEAQLVVLSITNPEALARGHSVAARLEAETSARALVGTPGRTLRDLVETARERGR